jgi:arylsulfatase A
VAVRDGDLKFVRRNLKTKSPGPWEVYDLAQDPGESRNLAEQYAARIAEVEELLRRETAENAVFPVPIPGVTTPAGL